MENEEKRNNKNDFAEKYCDTSSWNGPGLFEAMAGCCRGMSGTDDCRSMMAECMKKCRWFPLIPVIFGILLLLLGYYLDVEIIRILWMVAAGFLILMGTFCLLMIRICHSAK